MLQLTGFALLSLGVLVSDLDAQITALPQKPLPVKPKCPQSKCCSGIFPEGGSCEYTATWNFWEKRRWCIDSGKTCPSVINGSGTPKSPCNCCKSCLQSWTCRQKKGVCVDLTAPNMDWSYWNFRYCYSPNFVKCFARKGRNCYCCGWGTPSSVEPEQILKPEQVAEMAAKLTKE